MARDAESSESLSSPEESYWNESRRPLFILIFLLPLILIYEIGLAFMPDSSGGSGDNGVTNLAHASIMRFFEAVGIMWTNGLYLGGALIVLILLAWHLFNRDSWRFKPVFLLWMFFESLILMVPLLVFAGFLSGGWHLGVSGGIPLGQLGLQSKVLISVGAGLYEELVFRMVLIAVFHTLLVDVIELTNRTGTFIAVMISAAAFTIYHPLGAGIEGNGGFSFLKVMFYFLAGLYFGLIFLWRGFGIVVAVHAFYDIVTITFLLDPTTGSGS